MKTGNAAKRKDVADCGLFVPCAHVFALHKDTPSSQQTNEAEKDKDRDMHIHVAGRVAGARRVVVVMMTFYSVCSRRVVGAKEPPVLAS